MPALAPRDLDFIDSASTRIVTRVEVEATPDEVWKVITNNERWPEWFPAAKACHTTSPQAQGVGTTRWIHFDLFKVNERFIAWERPRRWAFTILDANLPGAVSVVEQVLTEPLAGGKTAVTYVYAADWAPWARPVVPILRRRLVGLLKQGLGGIQGQVVALRREAA
jgi:uncharacterized protein YndB with AHSA1/START domain